MKSVFWLLPAISSICFLSYAEDAAHASGFQGSQSMMGECLAQISQEQISMLKGIANHVMDYAATDVQLTLEEENALAQFVEVLSRCGSISEIDLQQTAILLDLAEAKSRSRSSSLYVSQRASQLQNARSILLAASPFTVQEIELLNKLKQTFLLRQHPELSAEEKALLKRYIVLAKKPGGLIGFDLNYRTAVFFVIQQLIGDGFSKKDLMALQYLEAQNKGISLEDLKLLKTLAETKEPGQALTPKEMAVLALWVRLEAYFGDANIVDLIEFIHLYEIAQNLPPETVSPQDLKALFRAAEARFAKAIFVAVSEAEEALLEKIFSHVTDYLSGQIALKASDIKTLKQIIEKLLEFGFLPAISPAQLGQLLEIVEVVSSLRQFEAELKKLRYIEQFKQGFFWQQMQILQGIEKEQKEEKLLTLEEIALLNFYRQKAMIPGGLNGFSIPSREKLFLAVQTRLGSVFPVDSLFPLRTLEKINVGMNLEDEMLLNILLRGNNPEQALSSEEIAFLKK
jgi:hypothetical protein